MIRLTESRLKWMMRFYPPMFFQRICVRRVEKGFMGVDVRIIRSVLTTNLGRSIFGGTIFAATDPFYALLFGQILRSKGYKVTVWLKSASIQYLKPGRTNLDFSIKLNSSMIETAEHALRTEGKFIATYPMELFDTHGEKCATVQNEIYIRDINFPKTNTELPGEHSQKNPAP